MEKEKLNDVTLEILDRSWKLKCIIAEEMIVGDSGMIQGIITCEEIVKEINPESLTKEMVKDIENKIKNYFLNEEEKHQRVNKYANAGMYRFIMMLNVLLMEKEAKKRIKEK